jgi:hypothetical protein
VQSQQMSRRADFVEKGGSCDADVTVIQSV